MTKLWLRCALLGVLCILPTEGQASEPNKVAQQTTSPQYGPNNELAAFGAATTHDAAGRMTEGPAGEEFEYDTLGRLKRASGWAGEWVFGYDPLGRLVSWLQSAGVLPAPFESKAQDDVAPLSDGTLFRRILGQGSFIAASGDLLATIELLGAKLAGIEGRAAWLVLPGAGGQSLTLRRVERAGTPGSVEVREWTLEAPEAQKWHLLDAAMSGNRFAVLWQGTQATAGLRVLLYERPTKPPGKLELLAQAVLQDATLSKTAPRGNLAFAARIRRLAVLDAQQVVHVFALMANGSVTLKKVGKVETTGVPGGAVDIALHSGGWLAISGVKGGLLHDVSGPTVAAGLPTTLTGRVVATSGWDGAGSGGFYTGAAGERLVESAPERTTRLQYAGGWPFRRTRGSDNTLMVPGAGATPAAFIHNGTPLYAHAGFGPRLEAVTSAAGDLVERYTTDALGAPAVVDGDDIPQTASTFGQPFLIGAAPWLAGPGLYLFGARWFAPRLGRWLVPDPLGLADGPNLYAFVGNQPLTLWGPWGTTRFPTGGQWGPGFVHGSC